MAAPVELSIHEWPPAGGAADSRVAVLVHGITGWSRTWWRVGPALAQRGWRVIAVDQRSHGTSPPGGIANVDDLGDDLAAAIERHAAVPIDVLIGHSLGAMVSQRLAWRRPDIARRLVLEDPPGIVRHDDVEFQEQLRADVEAARRRPAEEIRRALAENPAWLEEDARQDAEGRALCREDLVIALLRLARNFEVAELAAEVAIPARYVLAAADRSVMPEEPRRRLLANLPAGSDVVVLDGGHTLHRDRFDEYVATVLEFLG